MGTRTNWGTDPRRLARTPEGRRQAWSTIEESWNRTEERARRLDEALLHRRVSDEWSFVETLRHLIFVTDAWGRRTMIGEPAPYHRLGLPPDHRVGEPDPTVDVSDWGIDVCALASLDEVATVRRERLRVMRTLVDGLSDGDLRRTCGHNPAPGFPRSTVVPVQLAWDVIISEEWAHHGYAARDLAVLEDLADSTG